LGVKGAQSGKRVYGFIAIALVVCINLSVFLSLEFTAKAPIQTPSDAQPEASTSPDPVAVPEQAADANANNNDVTNHTIAYYIDNPTKNYPVSQQKALSLAMP